MTAQEQKLQNLKTIVIYSILGAGSATGLFLLGRHIYKKTIANRSQSDSMEEGDPATFAKQLKMAFDNDVAFGWGTNEDAVTRVFEEIPSKSMYSKVQKEYSRMYGSSLNADLEDELSSDEYNELIRILNGKK
jgi:Annexin